MIAVPSNAPKKRNILNELGCALFGHVFLASFNEEEGDYVLVDRCMKCGFCKGSDNK